MANPGFFNSGTPSWSLEGEPLAKSIKITAVYCVKYIVHFIYMVLMGYITVNDSVHFIYLINNMMIN